MRGCEIKFVVHSLATSTLSNLTIRYNITICVTSSVPFSLCSFHRETLMIVLVRRTKSPGSWDNSPITGVK